DAQFMAALSAQQRQAMIEWTRLGGRMVICAGARGAELATASEPLSALIPGDVVEVDALRERSGLESFTKVELPFDEPFFQRQRPLVPRLKNVRGEVLLDEVNASTSRPLAVHAAAGLGQLTFVGLDLDHPSLQDWKGRPRLIAALLQQANEREPSDR